MKAAIYIKYIHIYIQLYVCACIKVHGKCLKLNILSNAIFQCHIWEWSVGLTSERALEAMR